MTEVEWRGCGDGRGGDALVAADYPRQRALGPLIERMERAGVDVILVTDPEGRVLGLLDRGQTSKG